MSNHRGLSELADAHEPPVHPRAQQAANILKRAIQHMSAGEFDESREMAMDILNQALEQCFDEIGRAEPVVLFVVIYRRRCLAEFMYEIEAEEFAAGVPGSIVTCIRVPGRS